MPFDLAPQKPPVTTPELHDSLTHLVRYLRALPPERWNYRIEREERSCGTVGCALGHWKTLERRDVTDSLLYKHGMSVWHSFFNNGEGEAPGVPMARGWDATSHEVADRIEHWLATGEIK